MKKITYILFLIFSIILFMGQKSQNDERQWNNDPRRTAIYPTGKYGPLPKVFEYIPPSPIPRFFKTPNEVLIVNPNVRVFPSTWNQSETIIFRNPLNENIMFGSANTTSNDNPVSYSSQGVYVTTDGGNTWGITRDMIWASNLWLSDPSPIIDKNGIFIHTFLELTNGFVCSSYSLNNGLSFSSKYNITGYCINAPDKNMANTDGNYGSSFYGRSYVAFTWFDEEPPPIYFSFTSNSGISWSTPLRINNPTLGNFSQGVDIATGLNGQVYLIWAAPNENPPFTEEFMGFAKSTNGGVNWNVTENIFNMHGIRGYLTTKHGIRVNSFPRIDIDKSGGTRNGLLFIVYTDLEYDQPTNTWNYNIILRYSSNEGSVWSNPIRVNQNPIGDNTIRWFPTIRTDEFGNINVAYYDDRSCLQDKAAVWLSRSLDGGNSWSDIQVSDVVFTPMPIQGLSQGYQGDYIGITSSKGKILPFWMDNRIVINGINTYQVFTTTIDICPTDLVIPNKTINSGEQRYYCATNSISAGSPNIFDIKDGGSAFFQEANSIILNPGFTAELNSFFIASPASSSDNFLVNSISNGSANKIKTNEKSNELIPSEFGLSQNFPNPFNPSTLIKYALKNDVEVSLIIYNILGQKIKTLVNEYQSAGYKSIIWDGTDDMGKLVSSGVYIYKIKAGDYINIKKLVIIK